jgi:flagellar hook-associated protein 1 FlgK
MVVTTSDGVSLVGDTYAQVSYAASANPGQYGSITISNIYPLSGQPLGASQNLDPHLTGGSLKGMLDMRDGALSDLSQELGGFARQVAVSFNTLNNANTSYPPPGTLDGRDTGLMSGDALNFTGKTAIAIADQSGTLVSRVDVNFGAGTLSVDGGPSASIGSTVGSFVTALNTALGSHGGSASFANGQLTVSASGTNGIVVQDDGSTPASRAGSGFAQFFGLNDLFESSAPSILATGLSASDASGLAAGGTMSFVLKGPNGEIAKQANVTVTAGMTIGNVVTALNTAFGGAGTFTLAADGSMSFAPSSANAGYKLNVAGDTTARGTTGMGFTTLFGLGIQQSAAPAQGFIVSPAIVTAPQQLGLAQSTLNTGAVAGATIVTPGDARGAMALQTLATGKRAFSAAGGLAAQSSTLAEYAGNFYQDVATRSQTADSNYTAQNDRLQEAKSRQSSVSGVNLDEELSNMMVYQQAYAAGARILQTVQQMYDSLLQIS